MGDGKDRSRIEAVLNRSEFDIADIKDVVDNIYNGEPPTPGPQPGPTPEEDDFVKVATRTFNLIEMAPDLTVEGNPTKFANNITRYIYNLIADNVNVNDLCKLSVMLTGSCEVEGDPIVNSCLKYDFKSFSEQYNYSYTPILRRKTFTLGITDSSTLVAGIDNQENIEYKYVNPPEIIDDMIDIFSSEISSLTLIADIYLSGSASTGDSLASKLYFEESDFDEYTGGK